MATEPTDLVFKDPPVGPGPVRLVFGATGGTDPAPVPVVLTHYAAMPAPGFAMAVVYDNRVTRWREHRVTAPHQAAAPAAHTLASGWVPVIGWLPVKAVAPSADASQSGARPSSAAVDALLPTQ